MLLVKVPSMIFRLMLDAHIESILTNKRNEIMIDPQVSFSIGPSTLSESLSVLIVDDAVIFRKIISTVIKDIEGVEHTATAPSGEIALKKLTLAKYDLVLLDIDMPGIGGFETLKQIKRDFPDIEIIMVSGTSDRNATIIIDCMNAGAFGFVRKPMDGSPAANAKQLSEELGALFQEYWHTKSRNLKSTIQPHAEVRKSKPVRVKKTIAPRVSSTHPTKFAILAIGVSTGGPKALIELIPRLPLDFPLPIVIVQHMPAPFPKALAADLNKKSQLNVIVGQDGTAVKAGTAIIAPGSRHMIIKRDGDRVITELNDGPKENSCRPAVDVLFRSVNKCCKNNGVLALIMTGMGSDGLQGVQTLKQNKCYCMTQSEETCVVYGMPKALDDANLSDESVNLDQIASRLVALAKKGAVEL